MTPADELRDAARKLAHAYNTLAELKTTPPRAPQARKMAPTFGPQTPSPDGDWALNLEHELMRETPNDTIPGGLRTIALDALGYTTAPPHPTRNCPIGYLDDDCTPAILCAHINRHARQIVDHFPAADDLTNLLRDQQHYITTRINNHHGTGTKLTTMPADTLATGYGTAADLAPLISAVIGRHIDRKQLTYWGRSGRITAYTQPDGTTQYRIDQTITAAREYTDKRTGHAKA